MKNYKLALSDEILMQVEKPARYIGNEVNAVNKANDSNVDIRFAMCFPDVYEIGMSHLGIQILYGMLNQWDDVWCERVYSPWVDLDKIMREKNIPLFGLESQDPIKDFDFLGITIQYEMCYTNILQVLDLAGIPAEDLKNVIIAYEPVWAIGTGLTATPEQAQETCAVIRKVVAGLYGEEVAESVTIQYGGSMNDANAAELLAKENVKYYATNAKTGTEIAEGDIIVISF